MNIKNVTDIQKVLEFINSNEVLAFDTETNSLNFKTGVIIGFGISNGTEGYYITHLIWNGETFEEIISKKDCKVILEQLLSKKLYTWNAAFDLKFTNSYFGIDLGPALFSDGMLAKHTSNENCMSYGLKESAKEEFGDDSTEEQKLMQESVKERGGSKGEIYRADNDLIAKYCLQDCLLTFNLTELYLKRLNKDDLTSFFLYDEVMPVYREVLIPMEYNGIPLDIPAIKKAKNEIEEDIKKLELEIFSIIEPDLTDFYDWYYNYTYPVAKTGPFVQKLIEITGTKLPQTKAGHYSLTAKNINSLPDSDFFKSWFNGQQTLAKPLIRKIQSAIHKEQFGDVHPFNLSSKHNLKKLFFDKYKEKPVSTTDKGNPQVDDTFLEKYKDKYSFIPLLQKLNRLNKINGTYIARFLENEVNGVYYGSFFQHRTVSGRQSGDLQQLPRIIEDGEDCPLVTKYNNIIRTFFKTPEDKTFVGADYESLEPHIFAHVSTDKKLQNIFNKGHDFYSTIAIDTEKLIEFSPDKLAPNYLGKLNKVKRQTAKAYSLGIPYGMGGYKLSFQLKCSVEEADLLVNSYLEAYPDLKNWMTNSHNFVMKNGYIKTISGRIRRYPRAKQIYDMYGDVILDDLKLWKEYHHDKFRYEQMKKLRREFKNYINNSTNVQIQGLAASIVSRAAVKINKEFKKQGLNAYICLLVHDEIVSICNKTDSDKVRKIMQEIMESIWPLSVKLKAEPNVAQVYAETK